MKLYISNCCYVNEDSIDVSFLPPLARRKLSKLDKISLTAMNKTYQGEELKLVFASRYGELERLNKLISQYLSDNEVSPSTFSASVHNSAVGRFSLLKSIKKSYNSLAGAENTLSAGLLEAIMSADESSDVLFCYADSFEKSEASACIISKYKKNGSIECEFLKQERADENLCESDNFMKFINGGSEIFTASDGLYSLVRC